MTQDVPPAPLGPRSPRSSRKSSAAPQSPPPDQAGPSSPRTMPPKPLGPRSPQGSFSDTSPSIPLPPLSQNPDRQRAGSSRTSVYTSSKSKQAILDEPVTEEPVAHIHLPDMEIDAPHAPYREPEAVIEPLEEDPPGYVPGVVEEHMDDDDFPLPVSPLHNVYDLPKDSYDISDWKSQVRSYPESRMEVDESAFTVERPQIGPGVFPRRWLQLVHEHELVQPQITELPQPKHIPPPPQTPASHTVPLENPPPASPLTSMKFDKPPAPSLPDYERICTRADVWDACPGGEQNHHEWYFCGTCWGWIRIAGSRGPWPEVEDMETWELGVSNALLSGEAHPGIATVDDIAAARSKRYAEYCRYRDVKESRSSADRTENHFHEFRTLLHPTTEKRLHRITSDHPNLNAFPHLDVGDSLDPKWEEFYSPTVPPRLFVSCSSDWWIQVDGNMIAGQIPKGLADAFSAEKYNNPHAGIESKQSVSDAWYMLAMLLSNALFKGQRGWVSLSNARFARSVGMSEVVSLMLYHIGFACRQETDVIRVGPYSRGELISASDVQYMDRYMMRAWLEMQIYLTSYQTRMGIESVKHKTLEDTISEINTSTYPKMQHGYPTVARESCYTLGVSHQDPSATIMKAYDLQISCDSENTSKYLAALQVISEQAVAGKEDLQMKLALERSMGKYTSADLEAAYAKIGYTHKYAEEICVLPDEAPESHIYDMHKKATQAASNYSERLEISEALATIGRHRKSEEMTKMGTSGQTIMSVDEAYAGLGAPRNAVDDGLILQYEMAVSDYPGKTDHYRSCLSIIADAPGEGRPGIRTFLNTGALVVAAPPRNDIPVGLQNIGYLNSILQYLYSIKPLREAVMNFEQDLMEFVPRKAEAERSRRFVRQLRLLFLQLYRSESSAVRPDEELAYLAITRPEVDAIVEKPLLTGSAFPTLDSIPDMPSPSSTRVATPAPSRPFTPDLSPEVVDAPQTDTGVDHIPFDARSASSILGKRQSQDRDSFSDTSPTERARHKTDGFELVDAPPVNPSPDGYEMVKAESPSAVKDLADLSLLTKPTEELHEGEPSIGPGAPLETIPTISADEDVEMYEAPSVPPPLPARPMARRDSTLASGLRFGLQQDSAEVLINVLSQLELAFDPSVAEGDEPGHNIISELFSCKYRQQMFFEAEEGSFQGQAPVESVFVHPIIGVEEEGKDLYDCLGELYLRGSEIEYEGKKGYIVDLMDQFPPLLYIQMRRSQYDIATGRERKTNTHVPFGQTLQMDRFLATANPEKRETSIQLTRTMTDTRTRLHALRDRKPLSLPSTFKHIREALAQIQEMPELDLGPDFFLALEHEEKRISEEIEGLQTSLIETKAKLDEIWRHEKEMEYELVSVFMHRGKTSGAGHYWTYQAHLPDNSDKFFKYNDETVTEVPASEILQDRTGDDANPALLCYVRKGQNLVDTLHREILERASSAEIAVDAGGEVMDEGIMMDDAGTEQNITLV